MYSSSEMREDCSTYLSDILTCNSRLSLQRVRSQHICMKYVNLSVQYRPFVQHIVVFVIIAICTRLLLCWIKLRTVMAISWHTGRRSVIKTAYLDFLIFSLVPFVRLTFQLIRIKTTNVICQITSYKSYREWLFVDWVFYYTVAYFYLFGAL